MSEEEIPLVVRVNRLFSTFHPRAEPEQLTADVAASISVICGGLVPAAVLSDLRAAAGPDPEISVLAALAEHFGVPAPYLTGTAEQISAIDRQLRLLAATRDAGVRRLELRGDEVDVDSLTEQLALLSDTPASS
ncbi:hypothetical protein ACFWUP_21820 [Nocardia sp. NPDC058658]|uniref:hypothetical protein n=1 Tax=Nocardia sp. NPDC058658 TaxID=3346580 RepID=UPI00364A4BB3